MARSMSLEQLIKEILEIQKALQNPKCPQRDQYEERFETRLGLLYQHGNKDDYYYITNWYDEYFLQRIGIKGTMPLLMEYKGTEGDN